ncbi:androglobin [Andrena cerasifolii]|uniref:androglobin n=1 Tax=Andrena cerasifolii TaxID=2819439 RepID=UPI004037D6BD
MSKDTARTKRSKATESSKKSQGTGRSKRSKDSARKPKIPSKPQPVTLFLGVNMKKPPCGYEESIINSYSHTNIEESLQKEDIDNKALPEKTRRKNKSRDTSKDPQKGALKDDLSVDMSFWADFNKMEPFVKNVQFFYKLDYFEYTARISDRLDSKQGDQRPEAKKTSKRGSRKSSPSRATFNEHVFSDTFCWPQTMSKTRNEPLYIFTDSMEEKFFLIDFSTFQVSLNSQNGGNPSNTTGVPIAKDDYLIIEKHNWFERAEKSNCLVLLSTAGSKSAVMELESGRHLLRVYCRSESRCFTTISSDTIFHLGGRRWMYQLMSTESVTIDYMVKHISNAASRAYQSFGTQSYPEAVKAYYESYMPCVQTINNKSKIFYNQIHDYIIDEKVLLIRNIVPASQVPDILRALRIFFFDPTIGMERLDTIGMILRALREYSVSSGLAEKHPVSEHLFNENSFARNYAATVIQSFFKMLMIRKYKTIHDPSHKEHQQVLSNLLKVAELFNYNKRESLVNQLLRNMLRQHARLYDMYPCSKDFQYTLQTQELTGTLANVKPNQWLPIARLVVNARATEIVNAGIDLFVDLPKHSLRVFNNESGQEVLRVVNNVVPTRYQHADVGYTAFGYGWSEDQVFKELAWTMNIITVKGQPLFYRLDDEVPISATTVLPALVTEELTNKYIPNKNKYVSKWIIRVVKPSVVSLRLCTSYDQVKIRFRVTDEEGNVLCQVKGTSVVILPAVYLRFQRQASLARIGVNGDSSNLSGGVITVNSGELLNGDGSGEGPDVATDVDGGKKSEESMNHRIYYAEAFVLDDSWPLTMSEWAAVTDIRIKPSGSIVKTKSFASAVGRLSKPELLKSKKGSKQSVDSHQALEPPYWILQVVTDSGSGVEVSEDKSKEKEIAQMKEAWAKENPDSLERGKELRQAFLNKHELKPDSSAVEVRRKSLTEIRKSSTKRDSARSSIDCLDTSMLSLDPRTSKPPESLRKLPLLNLSLYKVKEEEEDVRWVKTEEDEEILSTSRAMNIIYAKEDYQHFLEDMQGLLNRQKQKYRTLFNPHIVSYWERRALLEDTDEARKAYVGSIKPVSVPRSGKKSVKSKKGGASSRRSKK